MWKTPYDVGTTDEFITNSGSKVRPVYKAVLEENGQLSVVEDGVEMTYEKIQSYKDSVDINTIIARYAAGDTSVLEQSGGVYADFISVPSSYLDVLNSIVEARNAYELKQPDISFNEFIKNALEPIPNPSEHIKKESVSDEPKSE